MNLKKWKGELDLMEEHLRAQRAALTARLPPPPPYQLPIDLGPLPEELQHQAEALLKATQALEHQVAEIRHTISRVLRSYSQQAPPPPAYLDRQA